MPTLPKNRILKKTVVNTETEPEERKVYDKPFVCYDSTPIIFGKLKGKPHSVLKQAEWNGYCNWIVNQGDDFKFASTRDYILNFL